MQSNITDEEIVTAFTNTNFGRSDHRSLLEASVLKKLVGYYCGHTITVIMRELGLIGATGIPTKKGKRFAALAYHHLMDAGG
jgi:hypothetical protein